MKREILYHLSIFLSCLGLLFLIFDALILLLFGFIITALLYSVYFFVMIIVLVDCAYLFGRKKTILFFILAFTMGLLMEIIGVLYGFPFGKYHYANIPMKIFNLVPFDIPIYWFVIVYTSMSINNRILNLDKNRKMQLYEIPLIAALDGLCATAWDLIMDPVMVHILNVWVWEEKGEFFGIPFSNFLGWTFVAGLISLIFRSIIKSGGEKMRTTSISGIVYFELWFTMALIAHAAEHPEYIPIGSMLMFTFLLLFILQTIHRTADNGAL